MGLDCAQLQWLFMTASTLIQTKSQLKNYIQVDITYILLRELVPYHT
jgi:hypothetical protein